MDEVRLIKKFLRMFKCDTARITRPCGTWFLIIGWHRNTRDKNYPGQWYRNGKRVHFDFVEEKVIASGTDENALVKSAKKHKRLLTATWEEVLTGKVEI